MMSLLALVIASLLGSTPFGSLLVKWLTGADVRGWLATPLAALGGRSPTDLLTAGRVHDLADLAVREWNGPRPAGRVHHLRSFAPSVSAR